ncbi:(2Fe-2S)-binding protein [Frigoriglobus tundricola]|uniref:(2Fe-2S)-binding protein n=1 Tax=Frigoriglobus tundricola TaxID=2774151 RepID=UPI00148ED0ED|nr:(2Fe-2S)-binding protein [Frigoriglobus tundricola]
MGSCPDRVVCRCLGVTEHTIVSAIVALGLRTVKEVRQATEAGDGCTCCHKEVAAYLTVYSPSPSPVICSAK